MNNFPHMMFFVGELHKEREMYDFEDVNRILAEMAEQNIVEPMIEPIDEETCHPMDYAEVTGLVDELADEIYFCP